MATILEFRVKDCDGARKEASAEGALGEIIIFPGVRIERHGTHQPSRQPDGEDRAAEARTTSRA